MTVITLRQFTPLIGKRKLCEKRVRKAGKIFENNGAKIRIGRIIAGDSANSLLLFGAFENFAKLGEHREKMSIEPSLMRLQEERDADPGSTMLGPDVYSTVYGDVAEGYNSVLYREYNVQRENLSKLVNIIPEIEKINENIDYKIMAAVPVISSNLGRMIVGYYFRSMSDLGAGIDGARQSEAFQEIVLRANQLGTLSNSRVVAII